MFWSLWLIGSALNIVVVSLPLLVVDGGLHMLWDVRWLAVIGILHLWAGAIIRFPRKRYGTIERCAFSTVGVAGFRLSQGCWS